MKTAPNRTFLSRGNEIQNRVRGLAAQTRGTAWSLSRSFKVGGSALSCRSGWRVVPAGLNLNVAFSFLLSKTDNQTPLKASFCIFALQMALGWGNGSPVHTRPGAYSIICCLLLIGLLSRTEEFKKRANPPGSRGLSSAYTWAGESMVQSLLTVQSAESISKLRNMWGRELTGEALAQTFPG